MPPKLAGGYDNYSLKSVTNVVDYFPGPGRQNLILDPDLAIGKFDRGKVIMKEQMMNGPGCLSQALPDPSRFQYQQIFAVPRGAPFKSMAVDDRQLAAYQVEQLHNNPLSIYTTSPNAPTPGFDCMEEPDNFSNMVSKRESDYKGYFESGGAYLVDPKSTEVVDWTAPTGSTGAIDVYPQTSGIKVNPNYEVVYNMNLDSPLITNPMIAQGSSSKVRDSASFSGKCYSGNFVPGQTITNKGGNNPPSVYAGSYTQPRTEMDQGLMNNRSSQICVPDRSLSFANPLVLNPFNQSFGT